MDNSNVDKFLRNLGMKNQPADNKQQDLWDRIIQPNSSYLIVGDVGTGKSALAYYFLETCSQKYDLLPVVVGFPRQKQELLPPNFIVKDSPADCTGLEDSIVFIDEADLQLPIEDIKAREYVVNFLSLPRQRHQIFLLAFHFPRLVLGRYLPFFGAFLLKRPPYLIEFASKSKNDALSQMMQKAEERFAELVPPDWQPTEEELQPLEVIRHTYVVAPRIRWQGMVGNPLCSFWTKELSEVWSGVGIKANTNEVPVCKVCNRVAKLINGFCPVCYRNTLDYNLKEKLDREAYKKALRRGEISLPQMKDDILGQGLQD